MWGPRESFSLNTRRYSSAVTRVPFTQYGLLLLLLIWRRSTSVPSGSSRAPRRRKCSDTAVLHAPLATPSHIEMPRIARANAIVGRKMAYTGVLDPSLAVWRRSARALLRRLRPVTPSPKQIASAMLLLPAGDHKLKMKVQLQLNSSIRGAAL